MEPGATCTDNRRSVLRRRWRGASETGGGGMGTIGVLVEWAGDLEEVRRRLRGRENRHMGWPSYLLSPNGWPQIFRELMPDWEERVNAAASWARQEREIAALWSKGLDPKLLVEGAFPDELTSVTQETVEHLVVQRRARLVNPASAVESPLDQGGVLWYQPQQNLCDGAAEAESEGFFNVHNVPPWDTWLGFRRLSRGASYEKWVLFAWVPPWCLSKAAGGVNVNPEECIGWVGSSRGE